MQRQLFVTLVFLILFVGLAYGQTDAELDRIEEKVSRHLENKMPGWKHKHGEPIRGSEGVLVDFWFSATRNVKISIVRYETVQRAREAFQEFRKYEFKIEELHGFGEDAYCWGYALSNVKFRRGRFIIYLSTAADVDSDSDARSLTKQEKGDRERSEMKRLSREFAKHVATAMDLP